MTARPTEIPNLRAPDGRVASRTVLTCGIVLSAALSMTAWIEPRIRISIFLTLTGVAAAAYLTAMVRIARSSKKPRAALGGCLLLALVCRVALLPAAPLLSDDVYRYVWDGRIQRFGMNPYLSAPGDPALRALHTPLTRHTEHPTVPTIYPPAAELFFRAVASLHESVLAFKLAFLVCDAVLTLLLLSWLTRTGRDPWLVLAYAWHPLVVLEGAGSAHLDFLGAAILVGVALALEGRRRTLAAVLFALSIGVKFIPAVLAPLLWRRVRPRDAIAGAAVLAGLYGLFLTEGGGLSFGSLGTYAQNWRFNGPVFGWLEPRVGMTTALAVPVLAGFMTACVARWRLPLSSPGTWAWPMAVTLLCMPAVYPWYLVWLTPFLGTRQTAPLLVWTLTSILTYTVWGSQLAGLGWKVPDWVVWMEYGLPAAAMILIAGRRLPSTAPRAMQSEVA